jgi:hypothetical protein
MVRNDMDSGRLNLRRRERHLANSPSWYVTPPLSQAKTDLQIFGLITIFMFLFLSIYFGSYYRQIHRSPHLSIEILDLDSLASPQGSTHPAILGPAVREQVQTSLSGGLPTLGYYVADDSSAQRFQITQGGQGIDAFEYAMAKVDNQDVWGVMIINANATSGVWNAITSGAQWTRKYNLSIHNTRKTDRKPGEQSHSSPQKQEISTQQNNTSCG